MQKELSRYLKQLDELHRMFERGAHDKIREELLDAANRGRRAGCAAACLSLRAIVGAEAERCIVLGDESGWRLLAEALRYGLTGCRVHPRTFGCEGIAVVALHALALEDEGPSFAAGALLEDIPDWSEEPASCLAIWLLGKVDVTTTQLPEESVLGGYESIVDVWEAEGEVVEDALYEACEEHLAQSRDRPVGAFARGYRIFAPDVHATVSVRRRTGRATSTPSHWLFSTPFAEGGLRTKCSQLSPDPLLEQVDALSDGPSP